MRLFVAVELNERLKAALAGVTEPLRARAAGGLKFVEPDNFHVTLCFLGEVSESSLDSLSSAFARAAARHSSFEITLSSIGRFPERGPPRVIWAGVEPGALLVALADEVALAAVDCGIDLEDREFHPHITLARVKERSAKIDLALLANPRAETQLVDAAVLFSSRLTPDGAVHESLARYALRG